MATAAPVEIAQIDTETIIIPIIGTTPLIVHNFSAKSKQQMLDAQQGRKSPKQIRDPQAEYEAAFYKIATRPNAKKLGAYSYGFPVTAFKAATVGAARFYGKDVNMTQLKMFMFFHGIMTDADPQQLVPLTGEPKMREDIVRLGGMSRSADLRYRPEFRDWSTELKITYVRSSLAKGSILSLVEAGGMGIGVGEWRPEKRGEFGTYQIDRTKEVQVIS
jgi:hypothetical protein